MVRGDQRPYPIQIFVNYWELSQNQMGPLLDRLFQNGISVVTSFVPWHVFESDISHLLQKFLIAAAERKIHVNLIVSPELGIHAPHSGFPKDLIQRVEVSARGAHQEELRSLMPPSMVNLPSHLAHDFNRRYHGFLNRLHGFLADIRRIAPQAFDSLTLTLGGGLWKY